MPRNLWIVVFDTPKFLATFYAICSGSTVILLCTSTATSTRTNCYLDRHQSHVYPVSSNSFIKSCTGLHYLVVTYDFGNRLSLFQLHNFRFGKTWKINVSHINSLRCFIISTILLPRANNWCKKLFLLSINIFLHSVIYIWSSEINDFPIYFCELCKMSQLPSY